MTKIFTARSTKKGKGSPLNPPGGTFEDPKMPKPFYLLARTIIKFTISKQDLQVVQILFIKKM
jgi:hypothetical protein